MQFLLTFWGEEQEALALLNKKGGREGSIESQQKFDFFSYDDTPNRVENDNNVHSFKDLVLLTMTGWNGT